MFLTTIAAIMKEYDANSILDFGKHEGKSVIYVASVDPSYLDWCILNIPEFYLADDAINSLITELPQLTISDLVLETNGKKPMRYAESGEEAEDGPTWDDYEGSYAHDEGGYDDDTINDAFEGDPDNYWNID